MVQLKKLVQTSIMIASGIALAGCAHSVMRGSVAMKISDTEAHVCMNKDEAKVGDHVVLYANVCSPKTPRDKGALACVKTAKGHGVVTEIINDHYSLVKFDTGIKFEEGNFVEKQMH